MLIGHLTLTIRVGFVEGSKQHSRGQRVCLTAAHLVPENCFWPHGPRMFKELTRLELPVEVVSREQNSQQTNPTGVGAPPTPTSLSFSELNPVSSSFQAHLPLPARRPWACPHRRAQPRRPAWRLSGERLLKY